ncbi:hypothetical protein ACJJTC_019534 [Scirpophaga incertulas]
MRSVLGQYPGDLLSVWLILLPKELESFYRYDNNETKCWEPCTFIEECAVSAWAAARRAGGGAGGGACSSPGAAQQVAAAVVRGQCLGSSQEGWRRCRRWCVFQSRRRPAGCRGRRARSVLGQQPGGLAAVQAVVRVPVAGAAQQVAAAVVRGQCLGSSQEGWRRCRRWCVFQSPAPPSRLPRPSCVASASRDSLLASRRCGESGRHSGGSEMLPESVSVTPCHRHKLTL